MNKICTKCKVEKSHDKFSKNAGSKDGLHANCKSCRNARYREYAQTDKEKQRLSIRNKAKRVAARDFVLEEKSKPCTDCRKSYPYYVMQFDHVGTDKLHAVAWMVSRGYSIKMITEEISKCELVCANCHAERTHQRRLDSLDVGMIE